MAYFLWKCVPKIWTKFHEFFKSKVRIQNFVLKIISKKRNYFAVCALNVNKVSRILWWIGAQVSNWLSQLELELWAADKSLRSYQCQNVTNKIIMTHP